MQQTATNFFSWVWQVVFVRVLEPTTFRERHDGSSVVSRGRRRGLPNIAVVPASTSVVKKWAVEKSFGRDGKSSATCSNQWALFTETICRRNRVSVRADCHAPVPTSGQVTGQPSAQTSEPEPQGSAATDLGKPFQASKEEEQGWGNQYSLCFFGENVAGQRPARRPAKAGDVFTKKRLVVVQGLGVWGGCWPNQVWPKSVMTCLGQPGLKRSGLNRSRNKYGCVFEPHPPKNMSA